MLNNNDHPLYVTTGTKEVWRSLPIFMPLHTNSLENTSNTYSSFSTYIVRNIFDANILTLLPVSVIVSISGGLCPAQLTEAIVVV